jgi:hypothetical protein
MKTITVNELRKLFAKVRGAKPIGLTVKTQPNKKVAALSKVTTFGVFINFNYANSVNNQLAREGEEKDFVAHPRKWGIRIPHTPLIHHVKDGQEKWYLEAKVDNDATPQTTYLLNGVKMGKDEVAHLLPPAKEEGARQGVEKPVIVRDYSLDNILRVKMDKEEYIIV